MTAKNLPDLAGALSRVQKPTAPAPKAASTPTPGPRIETVTPAADPPPTDRAAKPRSKPATTTAVGERGTEILWRRSVGFSIPRDVHIAAMQSAKSAGTTLTAWLLNALNSHHGELEQRLARAAESGGGLFAVPQHQTSRPRVQSTMRVTDEQYDVMERLADQLNTTRSGLLTAAAEAALDR